MICAKLKAINVNKLFAIFKEQQAALCLNTERLEKTIYCFLVMHLILRILTKTAYLNLTPYLNNNHFTLGCFYFCAQSVKIR